MGLGVDLHALRAERSQTVEVAAVVGELLVGMILTADHAVAGSFYHPLIIGLLQYAMHDRLAVRRTDTQYDIRRLTMRWIYSALFCDNIIGVNDH